MIRRWVVTPSRVVSTHRFVPVLALTTAPSRAYAAGVKSIVPIAVVAALVVTGCTRVVESEPVAQQSVGPILQGQVRDLLSENGQRNPVNTYVYTGVDPVECAGLLQEADAPLIFDAKPVVNDGGSWEDDRAEVIEIAGVYRSDYDATAAVDRARRTVDACQGRTLVTFGDDGSAPDNHLLSPPTDTPSPNIAVWSAAVVDDTWVCDNAFVAAYNAAVFTTACGRGGGYDVLSLAEGALDRIYALVNTAA